ncbi:MAG: hypothetical protein AMJ61_11640 [Desulfobacterales bacterium SG8_35_2]|nr:MAG: hypothetical protein AMJ61_11640 [Desulfobacterales bacterium SG8_35_2]
MVVMIFILGVTGVLLAIIMTLVGPQLNIILPIAVTGLLALILKAVSKQRKPTPHDLSEIRKLLLDEISNVSNPLSLNRLNVIAAQSGLQLEQFFADLARGPLMDQGLKALIEQDYKTAVKLFEENARTKLKEAAFSWFLGGNAFYFQGEYREAVTAYQMSTNFNPRLAKAWFNWAVTLEVLGQHEKATEKYQKAFGHDPSLAETEHNMSSSLRSNDAQEEAMEKYQQALKFETKYAET